MGEKIPLFVIFDKLHIFDALNSQYSTVRRLLWEPEVLKDCSSKLLNQAVIQCLKGAPVGNIMDILNVPGFELEESIREILSCYGNLHLKIWVAEDAKTALHILKSDRMFMTAGKELVQSGNCLLFDAIVQNPNFKWDEEVEESMKYFSPEGKKESRRDINS